MSSKIQIGDVGVTAAGVTNPYTYEGPEVIGDERVRALRLFRDGEDTSHLMLWYAPSHGGAREITRDEVEWSSLDYYDTTKFGKRVKR